MAVCKELGISQGTLSEAERLAYGSSHTVRFASLYKVSAQWLANGTEPRVVADLTPADESYYVDRFSAAARSLARQFDSVPDGEGKIRLLAKLEGLIRVASKPRTPSVQSATVEPPPPSGEARGRSRAGT